MPRCRFQRRYLLFQRFKLGAGFGQHIAGSVEFLTRHEIQPRKLALQHGAKVRAQFIAHRPDLWWQHAGEAFGNIFYGVNINHFRQPETRNHVQHALPYTLAQNRNVKVKATNPPGAGHRFAPAMRSDARIAFSRLAIAELNLVKMVTAIIKPFRLDDVREALSEVGVHGTTMTEVKGFGRQKGHTELYRGAEYAVDFLPKIKLEIVVEEDRVEPVVEAIINAAKTGQIGDGKIFVHSLDEVVRIRTGETDRDAI